MIATSSLLVAIVLLLVTLGIARRFLATGNLSVEWISMPHLLRVSWRVLAGTLGGLWRIARFLGRLAQGRRRVRRIPSRISIGGAPRAR